MLYESEIVNRRKSIVVGVLQIVSSLAVDLFVNVSCWL